jgi:hypothetical protein
VYRVEGAYVPFCASTFTLPPKLAIPVTESLSFCPPALTLTLSTEPAAKLTLPFTVKVLNGTAAPGATAPPPATVTSPLMVPRPASVPPEFTAIGLVNPLSTASVPLLIVVAPMVEVLFHTQVPLACTSRVLKSMKLLFAAPPP